MGFFSSRRPHLEDDIGDGRRDVGVIRSRFYNKSKGKERETYSAPLQDSLASAAPIAGPSQTREPPHGMPASSSQNSRPTSRIVGISSVDVARASTDAATLVLAQRLDELATANAEGLLDDDEYRILRQNLFERLPTSSPVEIPTVSYTAALGSDSLNKPSPMEYPSRPPSTQSRKSVSSVVSGLLKRATSRFSISSRDPSFSDSRSFMSVGSLPSHFLERHTLPRGLSKQMSDLSMRSEHVTSPSSTSPEASLHGPFSPVKRSPSSTRLGKQAYNIVPPPSSFHLRSPLSEPGRTSMQASHDIPDDHHLKTVDNIRMEIEAVEAEGRRVLDAFNGVEVTTLGYRQQGTGPSHFTSPSSHLAHTNSTMDGKDNTGTTWAFVPESGPFRLGNDSDVVSIQSGTSVVTTVSTAQSSARRRQVGPLPSFSLSRKPSVTSVSSRGRSGTCGSSLVSPLPTSFLAVGSSSSINLSPHPSHLALSTVAETDGREDTAETHSLGAYIASVSTGTRAGSVMTENRTALAGHDEDFMSLGAMADIQRHRAGVLARYEHRLDYLHAKLKGAELRKKLMRK